MDSTPSELLTEVLLGVPVANTDVDGAVDYLMRRIRRRDHNATMACANAHVLTVASQDSNFCRILQQTDLVVPDGISVALASVLAGGRIRTKVGGPDVFEALTRRLNSNGGGRYFFLGATQETLQKISQRLQRNFPNITVVGMHAPPMREFTLEENLEIIQKINTAKPDALWVGLSAPKQETWIGRHRHQLDVPVTGAIGGAFDFFSGGKRRPKVLAKLGLFWAYRLATEPRRLGRRYLVTTPYFLLAAGREAFRKRLIRQP